ncbi:MAG: hypothetical protein PF569_01600 [Candidatus Woesearchaeota archaeon]|jgi:hypothetical protein|nr:hypothetical protein [Candidatus Woesearchaeota archaeon]
MIKKKAQGLPVNIVVTVIIGIIIFGLGLGLFSKFFGEGQTTVDDIIDKVEIGISSLECEGDEWICSPTNKLRTGESDTFQIFIANRANDQGQFALEINNLEPLEGNNEGITKDCGEIIIVYPNVDNIELEIESGESASIPFSVKASKIKKTPCSFILSASIDSDLDEANEQKTSVVVRVD